MPLGNEHIADIRRVRTFGEIDGGELGSGRQPDEEHFTWSVHKRGEGNHELVARGSADHVDKALTSVEELGLGDLQPRRPLRDRLINIAEAHDRASTGRLVQLEEHELPEFDKPEQARQREPIQNEPRGIYKSQAMREREADRGSGDPAPHKPRGIYKSAEMKARRGESDAQDKQRRTPEKEREDADQFDLGLETQRSQGSFER